MSSRQAAALVSVLLSPVLSAAAPKGLRGNGTAGSWPLGDNVNVTVRAQANVMGDPEQTSCGGGSWCGGGHGDPLAEISCSSWPARVPVDTSQGYCQVANVYNFAGSEATATAWYDGSSDNFWVFHGCDGAGLQMGDCGGGTYYIEQFGPSSGASPPFAWPPAHSDSDYSTSHQRPEAFMHPGSFRKYQWYNAGMWTNGYATQWPDQFKNWWSKMGLPDIADLGPDPKDETAFAVMYPWVCVSTDMDWSWFWGNDLWPFGDGTHQVKCWYDNEPWNNDHDSSDFVPPEWQAYKFWKDNANSRIVGYKIAWKTVEEGGTIHYDFDAQPFYMPWVGTPPW